MLTGKTSNVAKLSFFVYIINNLKKAKFDFETKLTINMDQFLFCIWDLCNTIQLRAFQQFNSMPAVLLGWLLQKAFYQ
jgi:hypothetical protein